MRPISVTLRGRECIVGVESEQSSDPADGGPEWYFVDTGDEEIHHVTAEEETLIIKAIVESHLESE